MAGSDKLFQKLWRVNFAIERSYRRYTCCFQKREFLLVPEWFRQCVPLRPPYAFAKAWVRIAGSEQKNIHISASPLTPFGLHCQHPPRAWPGAFVGRRYAAGFANCFSAQTAAPRTPQGLRGSSSEASTCGSNVISPELPVAIRTLRMTGHLRSVSPENRKEHAEGWIVQHKQVFQVRRFQVVAAPSASSLVT